MFKVPPGVRLEGKQITLILKKDTGLTNSLNYVYIRRRNGRIRKTQFETPGQEKRRQIKNIGCECGSTSLTLNRESGEIICSNCNKVLYTSNLDPGSEWRAYIEEYKKKRRRIGSPLTFSNQEKREMWMKPNSLQASVESILRMMRKHGRELKLSESEMKNAWLAAWRTLIFLRKKKWNNKALVAASIYYACRMSGNNKRMEEIVKQIGEDSVNKKEALKTYRELTAFLREHPSYGSEHKTLKAVKEEMNLSKDILVV